MKEIVFYADAWYKVEYEIKDGAVYFKAFKIESLDIEVIENSKTDDDAEIDGWIRYDGCCEFKQNSHYCNVSYAEQTYLLMKEVYKFAENKINTFRVETEILAGLEFKTTYYNDGSINVRTGIPENKTK